MSFTRLNKQETERIKGLFSDKELNNLHFYDILYYDYQEFRDLVDLYIDFYGMNNCLDQFDKENIVNYVKMSDGNIGLAAVIVTGNQYEDYSNDGTIYFIDFTNFGKIKIDINKKELFLPDYITIPFKHLHILNLLWKSCREV